MFGDELFAQALRKVLETCSPVMITADEMGSLYVLYGDPEKAYGANKKSGFASEKDDPVVVLYNVLLDVLGDDF